MLKRSGPLTDFNGRTTADVLFLSPHFLPPKSLFYGAVSKHGFRLSRILDFHGKPWQLRTVIVANEHRIVPFCVNSGGVSSHAPIVGTPMLEKIGVLGPRMDRVSWDNKVGSGAPDGQLSVRMTIPSPLGELTSIADWDHKRGSLLEFDVRYNLIGHGFAFFIRDVEVAAHDVLCGEVTFIRAVDKLIERCPKDIQSYIGNPSNRKRVERELTAVIAGIQDNRAIDALAEAWTT